jgi:hypothetical protein
VEDPETPEVEFANGDRYTMNVDVNNNDNLLGQAPEGWLATECGKGMWMFWFADSTSETNSQRIRDEQGDVESVNENIHIHVASVSGSRG